mgnify:FL=1
MGRKSIPLKVVNINKPSKEEAYKKINKLSEYLSKNWYTPLEKQSNE